ncbi:polysaccharide lyase [Burkholderia contaminans]|uniref:heparin lyase I family protein n=1 Tax=Burkholderia contaminans TaxID=488447 RepID=UPI001CF5DCDB|nr:heparin lyase I family protein [Burkholderia contaminans]MCA7916214.1 polysaccharide lyase [Burkholderia contaminans]UUX40400.1 polysaccharide lyase [Burkholderia contaminans]
MRDRFFVAACVLVAPGCHAGPDGGKHDEARVYRSDWVRGIDSRLRLQEPVAQNITTAEVVGIDGTLLRVTMNRWQDFSSVASGTPRSEISFSPVFRFVNGGDYEVRWSTVIPADYRFDSRQPELIAQLHQWGSNGSPPFALLLNNGRYEVDVRAAPGMPSRSIAFGDPSADRGKRVCWVLRYRPDDRGVDALTDVFRNGERVVHVTGVPNAYPNDRDAYFKLGLYKWWWKTRPSDVTERTMYYGDIEMKALGETAR